MRKFQFNKLVRDKITENMIQNGDRPAYRQLNDEEFKRELVKKLIEEAIEFELQPDDDPVELLADVQEILDNLARVLEVSRTDIQKKQQGKTKDRGAFDDKIFISHVECKDDSDWITYYQNNPEKYPEIK